MADDEEARWAEVSFRQPVDQLVKHGPMVEVGASAPGGGRRASVLALIDTGAEVTCISRRLFEGLSLQPLPNNIPIGRSDGGDFVPRVAELVLYVLDRSVPKLLAVPEDDKGRPRGFVVQFRVGELPDMTPPFDVLLGLDVLAGRRLTVDFATGLTTIAFKPATKAHA